MMVPQMTLPSGRRYRDVLLAAIALVQCYATRTQNRNLVGKGGCGWSRRWFADDACRWPRSRKLKCGAEGGRKIGHGPGLRNRVGFGKSGGFFTAFSQSEGEAGRT